MDCFGAPEVIGKIGTDIQDNKCGWLVVQALKRATPEQRQVLQVRTKDQVQCVTSVTSQQVWLSGGSSLEESYTGTIIISLTSYMFTSLLVNCALLEMIRKIL